MSAAKATFFEETRLYDYGKGANWKTFPVRFALGFPNRYSIGMSNLGFLWIYHVLNSLDFVRCDRFFLDAPTTGGILRTLEMNRPLRDYDIVGFSLPFEMDFISVPAMLERGGIEPIAAEREAPLVVAGGIAASANPEPIADFLDIVFPGETENVIREFVTNYLNIKEDGNYKTKLKKRIVLENIAGDGNVYTPSLYKIAYRDDGCVGNIERLGSAPETVKRHQIFPLGEPPHSPITAKYSAFSDMFLVEVSRGCLFKCSFCLSRCLAGSFRAFDEEKILGVVARGLKRSKKIGLVGTGFSSAETLFSICKAVVDNDAEISFSSLRLTKQTLDVFAEFGDRLRLRTITAAPETASERVRRVIRKSIYEDSAEAVDKLSALNIRKVKLYFLIGVPGEEDEDAAEIVRYANRVWRRKWKIELSVSPLVPKPFTPMQWFPMEKVGVIKRRIEILKKESHKSGVNLRFESARIAEIQGVISRGDRRLGRVMAEAAKIGGGPSVFLQTIKKQGMNKEHYLYRSRSESEIFPWDILEYPSSKQELLQEHKKIVRLAG